MRHIIALVCLLCGGGIAARAAEVPKVTLGGFIHVQGGYGSEESGFAAGMRHQGLRSDTEIDVNVAGELESGLAYGAAIELEADTTADARGEGLNADKTYLWLESGFGRWELGNNAGPEQTMVVNAATIAAATGGIDGDDEFYINSSGIAGTASFLIHPDLPTADTGGIAEDASKITYYSPRLSAFQLGLSYTPDEGDGGQLAVRNNQNGDMQQVVAAGLSYDHEWDDYHIAAALVGEMGDAEAVGIHDLHAWQAGVCLLLSSGFDIAASYGDWGDSLSPTTIRHANTDFWTLGGAYHLDELAEVSLTYFDSDRVGNHYESLVFGGEYHPIPGLTPYAELSLVEADEAGTVARDNQATVLLVGTYLNF